MLTKNQKKHLLAVLLILSSILITAPGTSSVSDAAARKISSVSLKIGKKTVTKKTYSLTKGKRVTIKVKVSDRKSTRLNSSH